MKKILIVITIFLTVIVVAYISCLAIYKANLGPVSSNDKIIEIEVKAGSTYYSISSLLYENKLIKSELAYKIYLKQHAPSKPLKAGIYHLSQNMGVKKIVEVLSSEPAVIDKEIDRVSITFREGLNMRAVAKLIADNTNNTVEDVFELLQDQEYLQELIEEYWFIDESILNDKLYYPLEGYLFPNTYRFKDETVTVAEIFSKMLNEMGKQLDPYKDDIAKSKYSVHELLTLASIIELEAGNADDRAGVSGVFYNRLNAKWSLGSDVTTYYAERIDDWKYSLTNKELMNCSNGYNTRCPNYIGLPIGPISNPGIESIKATIRPSSHQYYYFVADCKGKTYLRVTYAEHQQKIAELKREGNWCES